MILSLIPQPYRAVAKLGAYVVAVIGLMGVGAYIGSRNEAARHAKTIAVHANATAKAEADALSAAIRLREVEAQSAATIHAIEMQHLEDLHNARTETRSAVLADLRSGRLSLRLPVRACAPVANAGGQATAAAGRGDADADSGGRDPGFVALADIEQRVAEQVAIAAAADATLTACQSTVREYIRLADEAARDD